MYHKVMIIGNLGRDPEMRYMPSGDPVTTLSVATNEVWNDREGNRQERTAWWRVSVFGKQADACNQYLQKGRQVMVEGILQVDPDTGGPRIWTRQDGTPGASFELRARTVKFLGGRGEGNGISESHGDYDSGPPPMDENDIPF